MQNRFTLFRRGNVYYSEDRVTGQQKSLKTNDEHEGRQIIQAKNNAVNQPTLNLIMAKTYLAAIDPKINLRTWADVMERFCKRKNDATRMRHERAIKTKPMQFLRDKKLIATTADDLLEAMNMGKNSTVMFLATMHNDALGMGWIPCAIL